MPFFPRPRSEPDTRRREDDGAGAIGFELDALEFVPADDDLGLLRVGGHWVAPVSRALPDIVLAVTRDSETLELTPLPDINGVGPVASPDGEEWRGAFMMAAELADDPRVELVLVAGEDARVELPRPGELEEPDAEEPPAPDEAPEPVLEAEDLRSELELLQRQLLEAQTALEHERRRLEALDQELGSRRSMEDDLRNAIAMQEAELASVAQNASQDARRAERRREGVPAADGADQPKRSRGADDEFLARLERARRAGEAVS